MTPRDDGTESAYINAAYVHVSVSTVLYQKTVKTTTNFTCILSLLNSLKKKFLKPNHMFTVHIGLELRVSLVGPVN